MKNVLFFSRHNIDPIGRGGHHRDFQIYTELVSQFGKANVDVIPLGFEKSEFQSKAHALWSEAMYRLSFSRFVIKNRLDPIRLTQGLLQSKKYQKNPFGVISLDEYLAYINTRGKPSVCVVDLPAFLPVIAYNTENQIPTIYCPHNLDAFDMHAHQLSDSSARNKLTLKWLVELEALSSCQERLMISKLETTLIQGLGMTSQYYPYLPVGSIRDRLLKIRQIRQSCEVEKRLFLMFGSITHRTTQESFRWFLKNAARTGLPGGVKIIVAGRGGEQLAEEFLDIAGIQIRGLLEQNELDDLLCKVAGVLVPQQSGFGAVTRISEMVCAGVPVLVSEHPMAAVNQPPGVKVISDDWQNWYDALGKFPANIEDCSLDDYLIWEAEQPKPLCETIRKFM